MKFSDPTSTSGRSVGTDTGSESILQSNPLRVLLALERTGSFAQAARMLGITQPGVSRALARLEQHYQTLLVERSLRGARLTAAGQQLISHARQIDTSLRRAAESLRQLHGTREGSVAVALSHGAIARLLPRVLPRFRKHWPLIELRIVTAIYPKVLQQLREGSVDLAVLPLPERNLPDTFSVKTLGPSRVQVIARRGHPLSGVKRLAQLASARWILPGADSSTTRALAASFAQQGLGKPVCHTYAETLSALQVIVASTDSLGLIPAETGSGSRFLGTGLVVLPVRDMPIGPDIYLVQRDDQQLTPAAQALSTLFAGARSAQKSNSLSITAAA